MRCFSTAFAKSERANIRSNQLAKIKLYAQRWLGFEDERIERAITDGDLHEVHCDEATEKA